jgi:hypothetical protein
VCISAWKLNNLYFFRGKNILHTSGMKHIFYVQYIFSVSLLVFKFIKQEDAAHTFEMRMYSSLSTPILRVKSKRESSVVTTWWFARSP